MHGLFSIIVIHVKTVSANEKCVACTRLSLSEPALTWCSVFLQLPHSQQLCVQPIMAKVKKGSATHTVRINPQVAKFTRPASAPPGSYRPQMGPMLAPWTLLSGVYLWDLCISYGASHRWPVVVQQRQIISISWRFQEKSNYSSVDFEYSLMDSLYPCISDMLLV